MRNRGGQFPHRAYAVQICQIGLKLFGAFAIFDVSGDAIPFLNLPCFGDLSPAADHLFLSYAWENAALVDWLVRRLTAEGYRVWCDRFQMLGRRVVSESH